MKYISILIVQLSEGVGLYAGRLISEYMLILFMLKCLNVKSFSAFVTLRKWKKKQIIDWVNKQWSCNFDNYFVFILGPIQ